MFRRMFWFGLGVIAGIYGVDWVKRKVAELGERVTVASVIQVITDASKFLIDALLKTWKKEGAATEHLGDATPKN
jgi:hypothetical protein